MDTHTRTLVAESGYGVVKKVTGAVGGKRVSLEMPLFKYGILRSSPLGMRDPHTWLLECQGDLLYFLWILFLSQA